MIRVLDDTPDGVLGVEAAGTVTADDYRDTLIPAIDDALASRDRLCLLYVLGDEFDSFAPGAMWQDAKLGITHITSFRRIAVVTAAEWLRNAAHVVSVLIPGEVRGFGLADRDAAVRWLVEAVEDPAS